MTPGHADSQTERIENIVPEGQDVLFMMVDAQGHDFRVLQGAHRLLRQHRIKVFLAEFSPTLMPGGVHEGIEMLEVPDLYLHQCKHSERHSVIY